MPDQAATTMRERAAKAILRACNSRSERRAAENLAAYARNPKNVPQEIRAEVKAAYRAADLVISIVATHCAEIADGCNTQDERDNGAAMTGAAASAAESIRRIVEH